MSNYRWLTSFADFEKGLARGDTPFFKGLEHGTMEVELYRPVGKDHQTPHARDELYIIRSGTSDFLRGEDRVSVAVGDAIFVPAQMEHRFVDFSDDFDTWVVFWGPAGGES